MATADHTGYAATATRLIAKHGRSASLVTVSDSGDAWNPTQAEATTAVTVVQTRYSALEVDGELVKSSDRKYLMDSSVVPNNSMRLRDDSTDYSIVNVDPIKPGDTAILYKVQARL